jgi:hypothetical protein
MGSNLRCAVDGREQHAKKLRDRAEECRRIAGILTETTDRLSYLQLAEAYENLAAQQELAHFADAEMATALPDRLDILDIIETRNDSWSFKS